MTEWDGVERRSFARRSSDGTCVYHSIACEKTSKLEDGLKNTISWKVFVWVFGVMLTLTLAYVGFAEHQHSRAYDKAEKAIEKTQQNKESLIRIKVTQDAVLKNIEKLMRFYGVRPEVTSEDVEKEIENNGKEN
jgi:hypothetical protein